MKCPGCEYELWNLRAGPCPECGRPFKPSEFDFLPNAVKFCCPHCQQAYYGTSEKGQLEPGEFGCVSCGRHVTTDEMLLLPAEALGRREATRTPNPWLDPHKKGSARWFAALMASIGQPGRMLEATPALSSTGKAVTFAMANCIVAGLAIFECAGLMMFGPGAALGMGMTMILSMIVGPFIYMFVWAAATHVVLKLLAVQTPDGMGRTVQAIGFSSGGWVFSIVPCAGSVLGFPTWVICAVLAVRGAHKTTPWRATIATLPLPALTLAGLVGVYVAPIFFAARTASTYQSPSAIGQNPAMGQGTWTNWAPGTDIRLGTQRVANVLRHRVAAGDAPRHVADLASDPGFDPLAFNEQTGGMPPRVGRENIFMLSTMDRADRERVIDGVVNRWPADITSHRLGRIWLTYHGVDPADPDLWLMVQLPAEPGEDFWAITMNGWEQIDRANPQAAVDDQNRLRMVAGLDPLPEMTTVLGSPGPWTAADGVPPGSP